MSMHGFPPGNTSMSYVERDLFILSCKVRDIEASIARMSPVEIKNLHNDSSKLTYLLAIDISEIASKIHKIKNEK